MILSDNIHLETLNNQLYMLQPDALACLYKMALVNIIYVPWEWSPPHFSFGHTVVL